MAAPAPADFDVIICHHHAAPMTGRAVEALHRDARESGLSVRIIVADNGSTAEERAFLQSLPVEFRETGRNAGYSAAINFGFPFTTAPMVIVQNEDVLVQPGCLRALRDGLRRGAVVGPELYWDLDRQFVLPPTEERTRRTELIKVAGRRSLTALERARQHWRQHARHHWTSKEPVPSTSLSGAFVAFRREVWDAVGPWDEHYQLYFEENDWMLRVEKAGLKSFYLPDAKGVHLHNPKLAQTAGRQQWTSDSFLRFGNHYYGERFMQRLFRLGSRPPVIPNWVALTGPKIEIDIPRGAAWPLWVELTPSPLGFPASAARITDRDIARWRLPRLAGLPFLAGTFYMQLVDDAGAELGRYMFQRAAEIEAA
jgi:N-acetylglucosaminyl-diphospho-decaprenol L-rhamnosyltransferase